MDETPQSTENAAAVPTVLLLTDLTPRSPDWPTVLALGAELGAQAARVMGFAPTVRPASLTPGDADLATVLAALGQEGAEICLVLPIVLEFSVFHKEAMAECLAAARREHPALRVIHDEPNPSHPLLVQHLAAAAGQALQAGGLPPPETGLLMVAVGAGDAAARAQAYAVMRLVWEQLSMAVGDVAFMRHARWPLPETLGRCLRDGRPWLALPLALWAGEYQDYARTIHRDFVAANPMATGWVLAEPAGAGPALTAWLQDRLLTLWQDWRQSRAARLPSPRREAPARPGRLIGPSTARPLAEVDTTAPELTWDGALMAEIYQPDDLPRLVSLLDLPDDGGPIFVKVTWHGYATGTYTDAVALDALLAALPGPAVLVEGHTSSRNRGGADWNWETEAHQHRAWIQQQDLEYRQRTGIQDVIERHGASYLNVTEAHWDGQCAPAAEVLAELAAAGVSLRHDELAGYVPAAMWEHRGRPLISCARFKGPTRLGISNCFGLIPVPLRAAWHGPNISFFAEVCCDVARLYSTLMRPIGLVESLNVAVRWNRRGLYRSRWGNYDLIPGPHMVTASQGFAGADTLACRLQGQDPTRSAFFDVVQTHFPLGDTIRTAPMDPALTQRFA